MPFFTLSDQAQKLRKSLLFIGVLIFLHTHVAPLSDITFSSVGIPKELLEWILPMILFWFFISYGQYLFTELFVWRAEHINRDRVVPINGGDHQPYKAERFSLIPELVELDSGHTQLKITATTKMSFPPSDAPLIIPDIERLEQNIQPALESYKEVLSNDIQRITDFQKSFKRYRGAFKLRFNTLDIAAPLIVFLLSNIFLFSDFRLFCN